MSRIGSRVLLVCMLAGSLSLSLAHVGAAVGVRTNVGFRVLRRLPPKGYREVVAFRGSGSLRTRNFVIPPDSTWVVQWRANCAGVAKPAFVASGFVGSKHDGALLIARQGRVRPAGTVESSQSGTFHFRVNADCPWRLVISREPQPQAPDPLTSEAMRSFLAGRQGDITAAVDDVSDGTTYLYRPGVTEQTASIVKVDILATLLWQDQAGGRTLDADESATATEMIEESDNDDATDLWDLEGGSAAVARFDKVLGLTDTTPNVAWGETTTTALDQVDLLKNVALTSSVLDAASRAYEIGLMEHVVSDDYWGVSAGPPATASVALKNGWLPLAAGDWQINSIGSIDGDGRRYLVAVLTNGNPTEGYGIGTIEGISRILWSELGTPTSS